MNENLKEIAIEAQVEHCISHVRLIEFAELIIRECCSISDEVERADTGTFASKFIKAHFGVE